MKLAPTKLTRTFTLALALFSAFASFPTHAAPPAQPLNPELAAKNPTNLLPADLRPSMSFRDDTATLPVKTPPATAVWSTATPSTLRVENFARPQYPDHVSTKWPLTGTIAPGDVLLFRVQLRLEYARQESGEGALELRFQQAAPGNVRYVTFPLPASPEWATVDVPYTAPATVTPTNNEILLSFGILPQAVEVRSVEVLNFGKSVKLSDLPETRFTYRGREENAAWRKAALERIEKIRTAPISLKVIDNKGNPIPDAQVEVRLATPAFPFTTSVNAASLDDASPLASSPDTKKYRQVLLEMFDSAVVENGMKWPKWSGSAASRAEGLAASDWLIANGLRQRGHCLVWPGDKFSPRRIVEMPAPRTGLSDLIREHIRDLVTATKGRMYAWDVINEMTHEKDYFKYLPETEAAEWFKIARSIDPNVKLVLNDYGMLNGPRSPVKIAEHVALAKRLMAAGAPIDVLGVQGHIGRRVRAPEDLLADLDLLAASGLEVHITEFDVNTTDQQLQADYTRDFLIALYSHPCVTGFTKWGFWQKMHWKPDAAMFNADWSEKPNAKVWRDLVRTQWLTHLNLKTDTAGQLAARGHLGTYEFTVKTGTKTARQVRILTKDGLTALIQVP